jgi:hypothetical protein
MSDHNWILVTELSLISWIAYMWLIRKTIQLFGGLWTHKREGFLLVKTGVKTHAGHIERVSR